VSQGIRDIADLILERHDAKSFRRNLASLLKNKNAPQALGNKENEEDRSGELDEPVFHERRGYSAAAVFGNSGRVDERKELRRKRDGFSCGPNVFPACSFEYSSAGDFAKKCPFTSCPAVDTIQKGTDDVP